MEVFIMKTKGTEYTPRQAALAILIDWGIAAMQRKTSDLEDMDERPSMQKKIGDHLDKLVRELQDRGGFV